MTRLLTEEEIENILSFIKPQPAVPLDTAMSVVNMNKSRLRKQLQIQKIYPVMIPMLRDQIEKSYRSSMIQAGESVGVICAQSIGEKQTQTTLNSLDWEDRIMYTRDSHAVIQPIGQMIDDMLTEHPTKIQHIPKNRTEYLEIQEGKYAIPATDANGIVKWYKIEAVTRHLPVGKLVKITTQSGRTATATQSKSFLVWNGYRFIDTLGSEIKVGDIVPTTATLAKPDIEHTHFDMETIFPKSEYLYTTELHKILRYKKEGRKYCGKISFKEHNGVEFTVPYNRYDTMMGKRKKFFETVPEGFIYIHRSKEFVSHIPDKIPLDNDFGFFIGLYLADGWCTLTFVGISNKDKTIRKRITDFCDRYGVTYHLVVSNAKNVRHGTSEDLKIHSVLLARLFKRICNTGSANKRVPEFAYTAPDEFTKGLIDGYFSGDGCVDKKDGSITSSSVSEGLTIGISSILSRFGIFGKLGSIQPKKNNVGSKNIKGIYTLNIRNGYVQQFAREITLTESCKQDKLQNITLKKTYRYIKGRSQENFPSDRDVYFDEVVSVEMVDGTTEFVYDLTVEGPRNFQLWNGLQLRDTFHRAGMSEKTMTSGVPRFQELINATKKPKIVNHRIYFNTKHETLKDLRDTVRDHIVGLTFKDISTSIRIELDKKEESWYKAYALLYNKDFLDYEHCISIQLNMDKIFAFKISLTKLVDFIHDEFDDLHCVISPPDKGQMDIFIDCDNIELPDERILFVDPINMIEIYLEECVQPVLEKLNLCGIPGIDEVFYIRDKDEWISETTGTNSRLINTNFINYKSLLALDIVDEKRTISNNVWDIYEVLGIEAARQFLIEEFLSILDGINTCHPCLLVDRMTHLGSIASITRYTMKKDKGGPFSRASFEETMDNFLNAASRGEIEPTKGVSASIICGKRAEIGTGMIGIRVDLENLPKGPDILPMEKLSLEEDSKLDLPPVMIEI